jgi:hypothetical protein
VTGAGTDGTGRSLDAFNYVGDSEPLYIWNQSLTPDISDYGGGQTGSCVGAPTGYDGSANYIVAGRDYFNGTPKPGYVKFTYPHPLHAGAKVPAPPANVRIVAP